jgi:hypothetical protein
MGWERVRLVGLIAVGLAAVLALTGGGGGPAPGPIRVSSLTITATTGYPGPPTSLTSDRGRAFRRLARLVPLPLPAEPPSLLPDARHPAGLTVCFPMDLTIGLSNGKDVVYPACYRPLALRRVLAALCPRLHKRQFCHTYRHELT